MHSIHNRLRFLPVSFVIKSSLLAISIMAITLPTAYASSEEQRNYSIAAGTLTAVLNEFALEAGILFSADAIVTDGLKSNGLTGTYTIEQGFKVLLAPHHLDIQATPQGYKLIKKVANGTLDMGQFKTTDVNTQAQNNKTDIASANSGVAQLPAIIVTTENGATSEGTGSYTGKSTVGKLALDLREIPQSVSVITRQQMDDRNANTVEEVMRYATGITSFANDGFTSNTADFYARGNSQLQVQYDGIKSGYGNQMDTAIYDRIEIQRGPAGLVNGSGSPAGTINLVRKRGLSEFTTQGSVSIGSWNQYRRHVDVTGPLNNDGSLRGRAIFVAEDREFFYDNADASKVVGYANLDYDFTPNTTVGIAFGIADETNTPYSGRIGYTDGSFPNWSRNVNTDAKFNNSDQKVWELVSDLEHRLNDNWKLKAGVRYRESEGIYQLGRHWEIDKTTGLVDEYTEQAQADDHELLSADINLTGVFDWLGRQHDVLFGYNYEQNKNNYQYANSLVHGTAGIPAYDPLNIPYNSTNRTTAHIDNSELTNTTQSGLYGMVRLKLLDPLTLVLGGRLSDYENKTRVAAPVAASWSQGAHENSEFNPYAGILWDFSKDLTWYASYADVFVPQTTKDWTGRTLDPKIGWQVETGIKGAFFGGALNTTIALFRIQDTNRAINDLDHMTCGDYGLSYCSIEGGKLQNQGWEIDISGSPIAGLELTAGYTRNDTKYLKDNNASRVGITQAATTREPKHVYKAWANYRFSNRFNGDWLSKLNIGGGLLGSGSVGTKTEGKIYQGGYTVFSLAAGYKINEHLNASLNINNIFDKTYLRQINNPNNFNYFGDPRNFMLTLRVKY